MNQDKTNIEKLEKENLELRKKLEEYISIFNSTGDIILFVEGKSGVIINVNTIITKLLGFSVEEVIGKKLEIIFDKGSEEINIEVEIYDSVLTNRKIKKKDGTCRLMDMTFTLSKIEDEVYYIINLRDAEERARAELELKEFSKKLEINNKTKDKFFSIIAHDLKSPFSSILGLSEILESDFDELSYEEKISYVSEIRKVTKGLYQLLENLLHWSRAQTGAIVYTPSELDLKLITEEVISLVSPQAKAKNIKIIVDFKKEYVIYADDDLLMTVLRNLLTNAIKYSYEGQKILINANKKDDNILELSITDFGIGIPENIQKSLFAIERGESRLGTNNEKGTGLGLILCKEFIELNKGTIDFVSVPNQGTTFFITIPLLYEI